MTNRPIYSIYFILAMALVIQGALALQSSSITLGNNPNDCYTDGFWDCDQCPCLLDPNHYIHYVQMALDGLGVLCTILVILPYLLIKETRVAPAGIIYMIAVADALMLVSLLHTNILYLQNKMTHEFQLSETCGWLSGAFLLGKDMQHCFTFAFLFFYIFALKNSLKESGMSSTWLFYILPFVISLAVFYFEYQTGELGMSVLGICTYKTGETIEDSVVLICLYLLIPFITIRYMNRYSPSAEIYSDEIKQFIDYYKTFVTWSVVLSVLILILDIVTIRVALNEDDLTPLEDWSRIITNIVKTLHPIVLFRVRSNDPLIKPYILRLFCCRRQQKEEEEDYFESAAERTVSLSLELVEKDIKKSTHMKKLQHSLKVQIIYTILSSFHYFWQEVTKRSRIIFIEDEKSYAKEARSHQTYNISEEFLQKEIPNVLGEIRDKKYKTVDGVFTVYASSIFEEIIQLDRMDKSMEYSLDLKKNFNRILKAGINTGGKSGEFFFFSSDNKLIIKTITNAELETLLSILPSYVAHFRANPFSLIAKIYGAFTFKKLSTNESYNLILMKNINGYPSKCLERKYDLKGSTVGRITIPRDQNVDMPSLKYYDTLKDLDFNKYEEKLWINNDHKGLLYEAVKKDTAFLAGHGLIDYSLAVYIINRDAIEKPVIENNSSQKAQLQKKAFYRTQESLSEEIIRCLIEQNNRSRVESGKCLKDQIDPFLTLKSTAEAYYYHIGIIDYLNKYTCVKGAEKFFKKLSRLNPNYDISVQNPTFYSQRFLKYCQKITF